MKGIAPALIVVALVLVAIAIFAMPQAGMFSLAASGSFSYDAASDTYTIDGSSNQVSSDYNVGACMAVSNLPDLTGYELDEANSYATITNANSAGDWCRPNSWTGKPYVSNGAICASSTATVCGWGSVTMHAVYKRPNVGVPTTPIVTQPTTPTTPTQPTTPTGQITYGSGFRIPLISDFIDWLAGLFRG